MGPPLAERDRRGNALADAMFCPAMICIGDEIEARLLAEDLVHSVPLPQDNVFGTDQLEDPDICLAKEASYMDLHGR